jgi:phosphoribosylanthranilate isomerase
MTLGIKICGLKTRAMIDAAVAAGADMVGLVIVPKSPRYVDLTEARDLARHAQVSSAGRTDAVALVVDPDDDLLHAIKNDVRPDYLQLHGHETLARVREAGARTGLPIIKAFPVAEAGDLAVVSAFAADIAFPLFDAKPPKGSVLTGGNGIVFDWTILSAVRDRSFMLSGGLTPGNVADAIRIARPGYVDVSSGVEIAPGEKSAELIRDFIAHARAADRS